jgi:CDP-glucose 4,6-dehydratase
MCEDGEKYSGAWNFGPCHGSIITVEELVKSIIGYWGSGQYKDLSRQSSQEPHEASLLTLDISKAIHQLNWTPVLNVSEAIEYAVNWYKASHVDYQFCVNQINDYTSLSEPRKSA